MFKDSQTDQKELRDMTKLLKNPQKYYDAFAPVFKYVRDTQSTTRKTNRVVKGENLIIGHVSHPSTWKRVYVGQGAWIQKGRKKRSSKPPGRIQAPVKVPKRKFIKQPSTYLHRELKKKQNLR